MQFFARMRPGAPPTDPPLSAPSNPVSKSDLEAVEARLEAIERRGKRTETRLVRVMEFLGIPHHDVRKQEHHTHGHTT